MDRSSLHASLRTRRSGGEIAFSAGPDSPENEGESEGEGGKQEGRQAGKRRTESDAVPVRKSNGGNQHSKTLGGGIDRKEP